MAGLGEGVEEALHPRAHDRERRVMGQDAGVEDALVQEVLGDVASSQPIV